MKKMYIFTLALIATTNSFGQDSNDSLTFESLTLAPESFYNGSDGAGQIPFNSITLSNFYDAVGDYWSGFSVSNVTDNTTPGYGNQYASISGSGSNSGTYGVFYPSGQISFNQPLLVKQLDVNNTTYAALSMRDGDAYAKQFGSLTDANGDIDGTNGEDYFILHIIPKDANNDLIGDTIDFYLADFRFADSTQDYILDTWTTIELENNGAPIIANKLEFAFTSSDAGEFWINTPTYFVLDNLVVEPLVGIQENNFSFSVFPNPFTDIVTIKTEVQGSIEIKNQLGQIIHTQVIAKNAIVDLSDFSAGVYFATLETNQGASTTKIIKQ